MIKMVEEHGAELKGNTSTMDSGEKLKIAAIEASTVFSRQIGMSLQKYYSDYIFTGPNLWVFGAAHLAYGIVNSINNPLLGNYYDRLDKKTRFKRFYIQAIPFFILGIVLQLVAQPHWNIWIIFACIFLGYSLCDTGFASVQIAGSSGVLTEEKKDHARGQFTAIKLSLKMIPGILGVLLPVYLLTSDEVTRTDVLWMFMIFGIIGTALYIPLVFTLKTPEVHEEKDIPKFLPTIVKLFKMRTCVFYVISSFIISGLFGLNQTYALYYFDGIENFDPIIATIIISLSFPLSVLIMLFSGKSIKKYGFKKIFNISIISAIIGSFLLFLNVSVITSIAGLMATILGLTLFFPIGFLLIGKIIDEYEAKYQESVKGIFLGINALLNSPAPSVMVFIFTLLITVYGYDGGAAIQSTRTILGLRIAIGLLPAILLIIAFVIMQFNPYFRQDKEN